MLVAYNTDTHSCAANCDSTVIAAALNSFCNFTGYILKQDRSIRIYISDKIAFF